MVSRIYVSPLLVYNLPRLRTSNVDRFNKRIWLYTGKGKKQKTITDADYVDDIANTPAQAESPLHSLGKTAGGIGRHVYEEKTEYVYFYQNLHTKRWFSETSQQVYIPRKYRLIYGKLHQHATSEGMESYR